MMENAECVFGRLGRMRFLGLDVPEWAFLLACFAFYALWCVAPPLNYGPDETMRFEVTRFFFDHGRLPVDGETVNAYWGFSYAHYPTMLCNVFGCLFMRVAALFTQDDKSLLVAARTVSLLSAVGAVYWIMRASRYLFHSSARWLFIVLIGALPQLAFVASYVNNDSLALLGASMVFFVWSAALRDGWSVRMTVILSLGVSVCVASYYNSYGWPLLSVPVCAFAYLAHGKGDVGGMFRTGFCVAVLVVALTGFFFVRHLCHYGDLLGFETIRRFAAQYSQGLPGGVNPTLRGAGVSLWQMLFEHRWIGITWKSFIGVFGYMNVEMSRWCYRVPEALCCAGALGWGCRGAELAMRRRCLRPGRIVLGIALVAVIAITVGLSMTYSYTIDFQPQGRYCFPALIPVMFLVAKGVEALYDRVEGDRIPKAVTAVSAVMMVAVAVNGYWTMKGSL